MDKDRIEAYARLREDLETARLHREEADYAETLIDEPMARQILTESERFFDRMERFLNSEGIL